MKIILSKRVEAKGTTDYAGFLSHKGYLFRVDWEVAFDVDLDEGFTARLMMNEYPEADWSDPDWWHDHARTRVTPEKVDESLKEWLGKGYERRVDLEEAVA